MKQVTQFRKVHPVRCMRHVIVGTNDNPCCPSRTMSATVLFLCDYLPISVYTASILIFEYLVSANPPPPPDFRSLLNLGNNSQGLSYISSK
jgi:hypothetical protein